MKSVKCVVLSSNCSLTASIIVVRLYRRDGIGRMFLLARRDCVVWVGRYAHDFLLEPPSLWRDTVFSFCPWRTIGSGALCYITKARRRNRDYITRMWSVEGGWLITDRNNCLWSQHSFCWAVPDRQFCVHSSADRDTGDLFLSTRERERERERDRERKREKERERERERERESSRRSRF